MHPLILPASWRQIYPVIPNAKTYISNKGLRVIVTEEVHAGQKWQHVSVSRATRLPTWRDIRTVKDLFIGRDEKAIMVLPADAEYINVHPYCMHMYCNLYRDPLPDFTRGMGII
jgi:hypothetical protein